jgi:hypothetical protein
MYRELAVALARAKERAAAKTSDEAYLTELLQLTYGTDKQTGHVVYRPFYVAAKFLEQSRRDQTLKKADGAEFTNQATPIQSLLDTQYALDQDLVIRPQFAIIPSNIGSLGELKIGFERALTFMRQFQPRGVI